MANALIFKKLLFCNWNNLNFLIFPPAHCVRLSFNDTTVARAQ